MTSPKVVIPALVALVAALLFWLHIGRVLFSTASPGQRYRVEVTQSRRFPFIERAVYLNAYRDDEQFVRNKLLYTGDFLDSDFRDIYPNPRFRSEAVYEIGAVAESSHPIIAELNILNETSKDISYLLVETSWYKVVVFDVKAGSGADLKIRYVPDLLSCQGEFANGERFAAAVKVQGAAAPPTAPKILLTISGRNAVFDSPELQLERARCCSPDRPSPDHESTLRVNPYLAN